jgi:hypothetical protein
VIQSKVGNCLELTVLFATVLEAIGINSGVVIQNGHAFLAVWLVNDYYSHSICDDGSFIEKKCAEGIGEMMVIECTAVAGEDASFESAVAAATRELADRSKFVMFIDVLRCRHERIFPLPIQLGGNGEIKMVNDGVDHDSVDVEVKEHNPYDLTTLNNDANREVTKLDIWERKLLDFSLRNSLLNLSLRRKAVQFISFDVDKIEDSLADGEEYLIQHKPEVDFQVDTSERLIRSKQLDTLRDLVTSDIKHHTLHTYHNEQDSKTILKNIYRAARSAIEETGANSLFMSIGTLRWFETDRSETPRYAPILLLPVDIVYKKGGYYVRQRDEEPMLNITLMEFLSQNFDMKINNLSPLPKDDHGVDVPLIFAVIRDAIKD